jgi:hypothetical protein
MNTAVREETQVLEIEPMTKPSQLTQVPQSAVTLTPTQMLSMAMQQGASLDVLERLMGLQERWEKAEAERAYNEAFTAFKAEAVTVIKNRKVTDGPLRGKEYAELFAVVESITPVLSKHGLTHAWKITKDEPTWIEVTCTLKHVRGHSESVSMGGPPDDGGAKNKIQARASTVSYLERYTVKAICGISEKSDDTDGNNPDANKQDAKARVDVHAFKKLIKATTTEETLTRTFADAMKLAADLKDRDGAEQIKACALQQRAHLRSEADKQGAKA